MKTVAFHNLGCKVNDYEQDIMQQKFTENDFRVVPFSEKADVYVINTCTVTNMADRKSRQMIHRAKKQNPDSVIIAVGCYVQTSQDKAVADECIDIAIGNNNKARVVDILKDYIATKNRQVAIDDLTHEKRYEDMFLYNGTERTRAYIKVQDGCNQFCSYCLIPYARGRVRSRDAEEIVKEIEGLTEKGYKEFVITGIHVSSYGIENPLDLSENKLADLLERINAIPGVQRIRLSSLEPRVITEDFVQRIAKLSKLCPHFHLSLQSGCDATLKRMNRHYTAEEFLESAAMLRKYLDNPAITTDVIVGFPGETEEEFKESISFAKKVNFYEMHIFKYSKRKGTVAEKLPDQVDDSIKHSRSEAFIALSAELTAKYREEYKGKVRPVLLEEEKIINNRKYMVGFTPEYIKVAVKDTGCAGNEIVNVKVMNALNKDTMEGEIFKDS
jgi:threonylcarbamoyladenosine tRNA methylthiotransferase MtaB